jgi:glycosyltransferase involved in cell wall biosynthesis
LTFFEYSETATEATRIACFAGVFQASLCADFVVAVSNASRDHFLATFPHYPADRVRVVPLASRFQWTASCTPSPRLARLPAGGFWLNVGTIEPRKNQRGLLKAYARLKAHQGTRLPLVLAGGKGWLMEDFDRCLADPELREDVLVLGYVEETELQWLYQNCFAFVYPSLYEGFGLPALEAMSLGAPVLTSNRGALPETVGSAGMLVDPSQEDDIFQGMLKLAADDVFRARLKSDSLERAKQFSWTATARKVLEVYEEAVGRARFDDAPSSAPPESELRALSVGG